MSTDCIQCECNLVFKGVFKIILSEKADKAYQIIKRKIIEGIYVPGRPLREIDIAAELRISRTPLREAFQRLGSEGFVVRIPNSGIIVSSVSLKELFEMFELRLCLEKYAVEAVLSKKLDLDISGLEKLQKKYTMAYTENDQWNFFTLNWRFHKRLVGLAGNNLMVEVIRRFQDLMLRSGFSVSKVADEGMFQDAIGEHNNILAALREQDPRKTVEAITVHAEKGRERLLLGLDSSHRNRLTLDL